MSGDHDTEAGPGAGSSGTAEDLLGSASAVLVVDLPSRDVPDTLARADLSVALSGGLEPDNHSCLRHARYRGGRSSSGRPPERADIVSVYRALDELPGIVRQATAIGATTVRSQSGMSDATTRDPSGCWVDEEKARHACTGSAGLRYVDQLYIPDVARRLSANPS